MRKAPSGTGTRKSSCSEITTLFSLKVSNMCQIHHPRRTTLSQKTGWNCIWLVLFFLSLLKIQLSILLKTCLTISSQVFNLQDIYVVLDFLLTLTINQSSNVINKHSGSSHVSQQAHTLIHWHARPRQTQRAAPWMSCRVCLSQETIVFSVCDKVIIYKSVCKFALSFGNNNSLAQTLHQ